MMGLFSVGQVVAASIVLSHGAWWTVLSAAALRRPSARVGPARLLPLVVLVPAHNEEALIGQTVDSLVTAAASLDARILVIADNCNDATAELAAAHGADVLRREDASHRGKPYALQFALGSLAKDAPAAVAVVDADTLVDSNFIDAVSERLASGSRAVQVHYAAGPASTDVGRLRRLAFLLVHWSRPLGASRLGLGVGLKGNGMAFDWSAANIALAGAGLTEDAAATLELAVRGIHVDYEPRTTVRGFMAQTYAEARTQDSRWEGGRTRLVFQAIRSAIRALARGDIAAAGAALEVGTLPLSLLLFVGTGAAVAGLIGVGSATLGIAAVASIGLYVVVGLAAARPEARDLRAIASAPGFLAHKAAVYGRIVAGRTGANWQRTAR